MPVHRSVIASRVGEKVFDLHLKLVETFIKRGPLPLGKRSKKTLMARDRQRNDLLDFGPAARRQR
jgi:hypothetical protein